jgi:hypothetical protein
MREVVRGELGRDPAPAEREAGADDRHRGGRAAHAHGPQQVGQQARSGKDDEHDQDRQALGGVTRAARRRAQPRSDHADHDRRHRQMLMRAGVLAEHPLTHEHQHEQARGERGLHDDQRCEQQRDHLQRPAEDRQASAEHPASPLDQSPDERQAQMLLAGRLLGVHRLQRDP